DETPADGHDRKKECSIDVPAPSFRPPFHHLQRQTDTHAHRAHTSCGAQDEQLLPWLAPALSGTFARLTPSHVATRRRRGRKVRRWQLFRRSTIPCPH